MWTLRADHWAVEEKVCCATCGRAFVAGDVVELHNPTRADTYTVGSNRLQHCECPEGEKPQQES